MVSIWKEREAMGSLREVVVLLLLLVVVLAARPATAQVKPGCQEKCGNLSIPYPFGTREGCYRDDSFFINCSKESREPLLGSLPVLNISLDGELEVLNWVSYACYNQSGELFDYFDNWLTASERFPISYTRNKFTVVGCDTYGLIIATGSVRNDYNYGASCTALCDTVQDLADGSCSGVGCCQTPLPSGVTAFNLSMTSFTNHTSVWNFNPCDFGFVVKEGEYNFSTLDVFNFSDARPEVPVVLNWAMGDERCETDSMNPKKYACGENTACSNATNGLGYLCKCLDGYEGNPYLGCQDIDECTNPNSTLNQCTHKCHNTDGNFTCSCPKWYNGDGRKDGQGCTLDTLWIKVPAGTGAAILVIGCSLLYWSNNRRKLTKRKEKYYKQNGGFKLEQELSKQQGSVECIKIFSIEELKKATNDFGETEIIGRGGFGIVYKGVLPENKEVAIKKSTLIDHSQIEQFVNEVIVVSQVNHRNVVKLLGCCLETEVPLLVYEFITNGTLFHNIHEVGHLSSIPWEIRLRIAKETAGALSYLHSAASTPIIHRDIKSTNILLDDNFTAKISDFGASKLVPLNKTQLTTMVQGTLGYLDPEYFHTGLLSEKSDVYSFGVVLVELITSRQAVCSDNPGKEINLATYFISSMKENQLSQILDHQIVNEANAEQLREVANLAYSCLRLKGDERPTMKEMAAELEGLTKVNQRNDWVGLDVKPEETEYLLGESLNFGSNSNTTGYDSLNNQEIMPLDNGR